ncbi:MAG: hypothetical protein PHQ27_10220 [Victivallales bacterium]|nr:hypothetical protein [Victivallales bacterium]
MNHDLHHFTLIEVVVALAVLMLGLTGLMAMFASSSQRATKAMHKWEISHALDQGCEYFMLRPDDNNLPEEYRPDNRLWRITCESETPELPDGIDSTLGNYTFAARLVKVVDNNNGNVFGSRHLELIINSVSGDTE